MTWSTRFVTQRLLTAIDRGEKVLLNRAEDVYQDAADEVAADWADKVRSSGRAPGKKMDNITGRVTRPRRGGFFVRVGWLNNPPMAEDGKTSWFVYQDVGYNLFGRGTRFIPGLMLQMEARARLREQMQDANAVIARMVENEIRRG